MDQNNEWTYFKLKYNLTIEEKHKIFNELKEWYIEQYVIPPCLNYAADNYWDSYWDNYPNNEHPSAGVSTPIYTNSYRIKLTRILTHRLTNKLTNILKKL